MADPENLHLPLSCRVLCLDCETCFEIGGPIGVRPAATARGPRWPWRSPAAKTKSVYRRYAIVAKTDLSEGVSKLAKLHELLEVKSRGLAQVQHK